MKKIIAFVLFAVPSVTFAQKLTELQDINDVTSRLLGIVNTAIYVLVAIAVLYIVYNVVRYLIAPGDAAGKALAGGNILWGIVGLFVIVSIWGIVNILVNTFRTKPVVQPIPNIGNNVEGGGIPSNQLPFQVK